MIGRPDLCGFFVLKGLFCVKYSWSVIIGILSSHLCRGLEPAHEAVFPAEGVQSRQTRSDLVRLVSQENGWDWPPVVQGHLRRDAPHA